MRYLSFWPNCRTCWSTLSFPSRFKYWLDGPIGLTVASMGVLINLVAIVVLARQRVQRTFHLLMIYLSFWDFTYLVLFIICFALPVMSEHFRDTVFIYLVPYAIPMAQICLSGSCYSTVALTVERWDPIPIKVLYLWGDMTFDTDSCTLSHYVSSIFPLIRFCRILETSSSETDNLCAKTNLFILSKVKELHYKNFYIALIGWCFVWKDRWDGPPQHHGKNFFVS